MRMAPLVLLAAIALPVPLAAQLPPSQQGRAALARFQDFDRNGDRALDRTELQARGRAKGAGTLFALLDADGDGRLSVKEVEGSGGGGRLGRFEAYDADKDGFVTAREFPNFPDPLLMAALDRDGDGRLALGELRPAFAGFRPRVATVEPEPDKARRAEPGRTWCWVPAIGDDGWGLEAVVVWGKCRTTASRW